MTLDYALAREPGEDVGTYEIGFMFGGETDFTGTVVTQGNYGVKYGSRPEGTSMGAYECSTPKDDPKVEIIEVVWYHCRSVGLYYPRITVRYIEGDATRILGLTLTCEGADHELPEACVAELRTATVPEGFFFFRVEVLP